MRPYHSRLHVWPASLAGPASGVSFLFMHPGALGDVVLALPVLKAIRREAAGPTTAMTGEGPGALLCAMGLAEAAERWGSARWAPLCSPDARLGAEESAFLRTFDRVLCIMSPGALVEKLERLLPGRVTWVDPRPAEGSTRHATVQMLDRLGLSSDEVAGRFSACSGASATRRGGLMVHPGSGSRKKCWPAARFARVSARWAVEAGVRVTLLRGPADDDAAEVFRRAADGMPYEDLRTPSSEELSGRLTSCACFLGNDSGVTHLASVLGTPTVAVYGPTDARVWGPLGPRTVVLQAACPRGCRTSGVYRSAAHCEQGECLAVIGEESVAAALRDLTR